MKANLYIVRHGKVNRDEKNRAEYLHLNEEGIAFRDMLNDRFKETYFDHIFYQTIDVKNSDPYNICQNTVRGLKGIKSEFDKTQVSRVFEGLNTENSEVLNVLICFRSEAYNVISNIISPVSEDEFNKEYHRVFHYRFRENRYQFMGKLTLNTAV
ncbi:MAG: hypothetical protein IPI66_12100 [Chitinophagaceae bacterium]|nr:hypothetical protein [Chitinophagaceae bacterium]MBL0056306.1 hypothetical protein [Chitinophagaceae bacterium]